MRKGLSAIEKKKERLEEVLKRIQRKGVIYPEPGEYLWLRAEIAWEHGVTERKAGEYLTHLKNRKIISINYKENRVSPGDLYIYPDEYYESGGA